MNARTALAAVLIAGGLALTPSTAFAQYDTKVAVCHKPSTPAQQTLTVAPAAVDAHLAHGDYAGLCVTLELDPSPAPSGIPAPSPSATPAPEPSVAPDPEPTVAPEPEIPALPAAPAEYPPPSAPETPILAETGIDETAATIIGALTLAAGLVLFALGEFKKRSQR